MTVLVMDVVATIQYGLDIGAVLSNGSLMALMGNAVTPDSQVEKFIKEVPVMVAVVPSVVMTLAASRCFILWAINLIFFFGVMVTCGRAPIKKKDTEPLSQHHNTQVAPIKAHGATPARQDEFMWRGGPQQNLSYIGYDEAYDRDPGPIPQRL
ncbi:hypothetical protein B566_EDAN004760 [Ephemera danica]|nr:hypothetical protein B566_EDAN004760 [Ephemera danica]